MATHRQSIIYFEQGWDFIQRGIQKQKNILEGLPEPDFEPAEIMTLYTTVYDMCTQKPPHDYSTQLYDKYRESFVEYITSTVLPCLREKRDELMLRELVKRWSNHKIMVLSLFKIFRYLDRFYIARMSRPSLREVGLTTFKDMVYLEIKGQVRDAVISMIGREREGEQIDQDLLKNVINIFFEIGLGGMEIYHDFEEAMLKATEAYYSHKASNWILHDSGPQYMLKAEECLEREKYCASHYLPSSSETKLLQRVQNELLSVHTIQLLEKKQSGCDALLRHDKVEDLSRMYRLFSRIPRGLDPIANIFKQHVTVQATALLKEVEDVASNRKVIVGKVNKLHGKFMGYVYDCFQNDALFHKAVEEGFEVLSCYNKKGVAAEIEAIEESLEWVLLDDDEVEKMLVD